MSLGNITFIKGQGGLGRPLPGQDYVSGFIFYTPAGNVPASFSATPVQVFFSPADAINAGIVPYTDNTAASAMYTMNNSGNAGDTINISVTGINGVVYNLVTYTLPTTGISPTLVISTLSAAINAGTPSHGFSSTVNSTSLLIIAPTNQGIFLNGASPLVTVNGVSITSSGYSGSFGGSIEAFGASGLTTGTVSEYATWYYQVSEYFRIQPKGQLYVTIVNTTAGGFSWDDYTYADITNVQRFSGGIIRQVALWKGSEGFHTQNVSGINVMDGADITAIHNEIVNNDDANHQPLSALFAANLLSVSTGQLASYLVNLQILTANKVSVVVSQDAGGQGYYLTQHCNYSIPAIGAALGAVALASVADSIEWIANFNMSNGLEDDTVAFANGDLISAAAPAYLNAVDNLGYIFMVNYVGIAGSYWNHDYTAISNSSDYSRIRNNRTIDKAIRGIYASVLPALGSPLTLNSDGTLANETIAYFSDLASVNLVQMVRDSELSDYGILINPTQNVQSTGELIIAVQLLEIGAAEAIQVNIGFTTSITQ